MVRTPVIARTSGTSSRIFPVTVTTAADQRFAWRQRPIDRVEHHTLLVTINGAGTHSIDFEDHVVEPGIVLHVRPGQVHGFDPEATFDAYLVRVDPNRCPPAIVARNRPDPAVRLPSASAGVVRSLAEALLTESQRCEADPDVLLSGAMLLFDQLNRVRLDPGPASRGHVELVQRFEAEVERNFTRSRTVSVYARSIGTSTKTLSRATAAVAGCAPKELIDRRVALEGKRLLALTADPIATIGSTLGFSDPTNFTKFFARNVGITPHEFRARHRLTTGA